ncbi:NAD(P)/FAD-dependent oxidoreductase [Pseudoduganella namucuonensis]|uniref:Sarcosine oxidase subunit beta n=1 Tax=Pseudoduganella namucuonensis TaxID=1035707 RepID=A0A1I7K1F9_9BURK|nr:FAD-binding oxidoreductase [Pseudoduganella namucuonensis]SFU91231.1 sarcosine oxidase subunit beta [Pseudoduganella namucuonensis]
MSHPTHADVVIVGGGLMGASTAFFLRQRGVSVILLERGLTGQQASGVNFGNVRRQGRPMAQLPLSHRAHRVWQRLPELLGEDAEYLQTGHLRCAYDQQHIEVLEKYASEARHHGLALDILGEKTIRQRYPFLGKEVIAGSLAPEDGHANPRLAAPAFARAAARAGAHIIENTEVLSIVKDGVDFRASCAGGAEYRAPVLLVASGAWGDKMAAQFGEHVPMDVRGPQMGVTEPVPYVIGPAIGVAVPSIQTSLYFRQVKRGNIVFGGCGRGPANPDTRRAYVLPEHTLAQFRQMARLAPVVSKLNIIRVWSGIEGYMRDDKPVMGPSARVSGLHYAFGFCGHGFQLGPGVGDVMAELIATGATSTPIEPYHIGRFSDLAAQAA